MSLAPTVAASSGYWFSNTIRHDKSTAMTNLLRRTAVAGCELCSATGGDEIYRTEDYRVVMVDDANYPGFCRVILNDHVREMSALAGTNRAALMEAVWQVEAAVLEVMSPAKINLASLGNAVPHLHWHVIPRYDDDAHFPGPVWAAQQRKADEATLAQRRAMLPALRVAILRRLAITGQSPATQEAD
jgi:diadenosine tetraphosphate (Ap4A) HIT family hydrolase